MEKQKIKDRKVKDILEAMIGKEDAEKVLIKIQEEYDKGVKGQEFIDHVKRIIDEIPNFDDESEKLAVAVIILCLPHHPLSLPHHPFNP
jgi:N-acetyl-gamma-glutamylphosphate reductase